MRQLLCLAAVAALVAGCESPNFRFTSADFGDAKALAAGGNLRLITERTRPLAGGAYASDRDWKVMCSEPSPDYLVTFNRKADVQTQGLVVENPSSKASVTLSSEETGSKGEGRTAGVIALRDGLYAACQAYANGIIGQDAYSAILSQYGFLITTVAVSAGTNPKADAAAKSSSAFAAVLVACMSAHDPSRPTPANGNPIFDRATCRQIVRNAGRGGLG